MPEPLLPLDRAIETTMFRAVVALFQGNETLQRVVPTWQTWDGSNDETKSLTEEQLPAIRLSPDLEAISLVEVTGYDESLAVWIDFAVSGTNADDRLNLWGAIRESLNYESVLTGIGANVDGTAFTGTSVNDFIRSNGLVNIRITQPARLVVPPVAMNQLFTGTSQYCRARVLVNAYTPVSTDA